MIKFRFINTDFRVDFGFFAIAALVFSMENAALLILSAAACAIHETGHVLPMILFKKKIKSVSLNAIGIKIFPANDHIHPIFSDILIILGGITFNFITALICIQSNIYEIRTFAIINTIIGTFNLLPFSNFDGGTLIYTLMDYKGSNHYDIKKFIKFVNIVISFLIFIAAYAADIKNISFYATIFYLIAVEIFFSN